MLKLRYVYIRCQSTGISVKVAVCIYHISINEEKCSSCGMYISDISQRGKVLKLRYVFIRCHSTMKSVKVAVCIYHMSTTRKSVKVSVCFYQMSVNEEMY